MEILRRLIQAKGCSVYVVIEVRRCLINTYSPPSRSRRASGDTGTGAGTINRRERLSGLRLPESVSRCFPRQTPRAGSA